MPSVWLILRNGLQPSLTESISVSLWFGLMFVAGQDKCVHGLCVHSFCNIVEDNKGLGLE